MKKWIVSRRLWSKRWTRTTDSTRRTIKRSVCAGIRSAWSPVATAKMRPLGFRTKAGWSSLGQSPCPDDASASITDETKWIIHDRHPFCCDYLDQYTGRYLRSSPSWLGRPLRTIRTFIIPSVELCWVFFLLALSFRLAVDSSSWKLIQETRRANFFCLDMRRYAPVHIRLSKDLGLSWLSHICTLVYLRAISRPFGS
jgi:hypothetical protein